MKFRKKPVVIEAFRIGQDPIPDWAKRIEFGNIHGVLDCYIETMEGRMYASHGDWIIKGIKGELYPCKPDIFEATYEPADPTQPDKSGGE